MQPQHYDAIIDRIKDSLAQLTEREIALLILNARSHPSAYNLAIGTTQTVLELARQELFRRR